MGGCSSNIINQSFTGSICLADLRVNYVVGSASKINTICCCVQPLTNMNHFCTQRQGYTKEKHAEADTLEWLLLYIFNDQLRKCMSKTSDRESICVTVLQMYIEGSLFIVIHVYKIIGVWSLRSV